MVMLIRRVVYRQNAVAAALQQLDYLRQCLNSCPFARGIVHQYYRIGRRAYPLLYIVDQRLRRHIAACRIATVDIPVVIPVSAPCDLSAQASHYAAIVFFADAVARAARETHIPRSDARQAVHMV